MNRYLLARGGYTNPLTLVRTGDCPKGEDLVPFGNLVLDIEMQVREARPVDGDGLFDALEIARDAWRRVVHHQAGRGQLLVGSDAALIPYLVEAALV